MIDYKELLIKYIEHVGQLEGVTYIDHINTEENSTLSISSVPFTAEEKSELEILSYSYDKYKYEENNENT